MNLENRKNIENRLKALRHFLQTHHFKGMLVPRTDEFLNAFIPLYAERLAWLTGFTGSTGLALVTLDEVILFVDGRYQLQAAQEVIPDVIRVMPWTWMNFEQALEKSFSSGETLAYDPWLHSLQDIKRTEKVGKSMGLTVAPLTSNPIDFLWENQPPRPQERIKLHPLEFAGASFEDKKKQILEAQLDGDLWVLTDNTSLSWLLNIRGNDLPYTPVPQVYGLLYREGMLDFFVDRSKLSSKLVKALGTDVHFFSLDYFSTRLQEQSTGRRVSVDPQKTPAAVGTLLQNAEVVFQGDPCTLLKSVKNQAEIEGMKKAHQLDGVALVRFFHWLSQQPLDGTETERSAAEKLEGFRSENEGYVGPSFETIAAHGPHGAIIHYHQTPQSNRPLTGLGELFLIDSGGQYSFGGTTDVTRTLALGPPSRAQKEHYTRVLKGHIALATAIFPVGTSGGELDILARRSLWDVGLDYTHATGHGVGSYLCVHESPPSLSRRGDQTPLAPGMILSNEPGYYLAGEYGIRIESLILVIEKQVSRDPEGSGDPLGRQMLGFETLTLVPLETTLMDESLLSPAEKAWIEDYHHRIYTSLSPFLGLNVCTWLKKILKC